MDDKPANQLTPQEAPAIPKNGNSAPKNIPLIRLIELRKKGLSFSEIGQLLGCSMQDAQQRLAPFMEAIEHLPAIKEHRADLLTVYGHTMLATLSAGDIQKASAYQRVGMAGLLHNMERLERGQSTANVSVADYTAKLVDLRTERERLEAALGGPITDESEVIDV